MSGVLNKKLQSKQNSGFEEKQSSWWCQIALKSRFGLLYAWIILVVFFSILKPSVFFTKSNFAAILALQSIMLTLTLALIPSLAAGEFDMSAGGVLGLSLVLVGYLNVLKGWPIGLTIMVALGSGLLVGLINTLLIVILDMDSIVVTLGMGTLLAGLAMGINSLPIGGISKTLVNAVRHEVFGLQMSFFYTLALTVLLWYVFSYTPLGRYIYFVGGGRNVAQLAGIRVKLIRSLCLVFASFVAAADGVMLAGQLGSSDPTIGPTLILPAFASAFLGTTAVVQGRFNPWGSFIAVYFIATGVTGLQLLGLSGWIEQVFYGAALIVGVMLSRLSSQMVSEN